MPNERPNDLHLPDLSISDFRGIHRLSIRRLGRVTLLGGRNGVGKTTVLEAVRVYAARGQPRVLDEVLDEREEFTRAFAEDRLPVRSRDYTALFHGRAATRERTITIGPRTRATDVVIQLSPLGALTAVQQEFFADISMVGDWPFIRIRYSGRETLLPAMPVERDSRVAELLRDYSRVRRRSPLDTGNWQILECESLGPGLPTNSKLARFWDSVALTEKEDLSLQALRLVGDSIERVAVVGDEGSRYRGGGRRVVVKLLGHRRPVPLKSLGDGVTRLFAAGLALANSRDGFLIIDEAENGIHYSLQRAFWGMVLRAAHEHNVQVLATTHSSDCVRGFALAAAETEEVEGVYLRLERDGDHVRAVEYTEEELETVAEQAIEVR